MYTREEIIEFIREEDVKFVRMAFFDVFGKQKNISIMASEAQKAFNEGVAFDASAVCGFEGPEKSDLFLHPDPATAAILPWRPSNGRVMRMFCDIRRPDGAPYARDGRYILKKAIETARKEAGIDLVFGSELEFYLFKPDENTGALIPLDNAGYMDISPDDKGEDIRRDICFTLEQMGISPQASHHEREPGQNEIDFKYSDALSAADDTSTFKWIVRTKAAINGLTADFSPKPLEQYGGNGMRINIECRSRDGNDKTDMILAGILKRIRETTLFLNPVRASYRRLGAAKTPLTVTWNREDRSQLIRIPAVKSRARRLELRSPDPEANPYLAFALIIYAALDGVKNALVPPPPDCGESAQKSETLPASLEEAFDLASKSEFVKSILDDVVISAYKRF